MRIRTLFFALYRDLAGAPALELELPAGARVLDVVQRLRSGGGAWARFPAEPVAAVNQRYAPLTAELRDGDEVAFIPPVSGG